MDVKPQTIILPERSSLRGEEEAKRGLHAGTATPSQIKGEEKGGTRREGGLIEREKGGQTPSNATTSIEADVRTRTVDKT